MTVNPKSTKFTQCEAYTTGNGNNSSIGVLEVFRYWQIIPLAQLVFACIQTIFPPTNSLRNTLTPTPPPHPTLRIDCELLPLESKPNSWIQFFPNCVTNKFIFNYVYAWFSFYFNRRLLFINK